MFPEKIEDEVYTYTVKVASIKASFYYISKKDFKTKFPNNLISDLYNKYVCKEKIRSETYKYLVEQTLNNYKD